MSVSLNSDPQSPDIKIVEGIIERIVFHNEDNGFSVIRVKAKDHKGLVTVVGNILQASEGEKLHAEGTWIQDKKFGPQFKATALRAVPPATIEGIKKYLSSGSIRGIGPKYAKRLVEKFGEKVLEIIEDEPERLLEVEGIGGVRYHTIRKDWAGQKTIRDIMIFLYQNGISTLKASQIFKAYGAKSVELLTQNPYRLANDIRGIGFLTADTIAQKMGIERDSPLRAQAGLLYALQQARESGHCGFPRESLLDMAEDILQVSRDLVETALQAELLSGKAVEATIGDQNCIFLKELYNLEKNCAQLLQKLAEGSVPWIDVDPKTAIPLVEEKLNIELANSQKEALHTALHSKLLILTGGPGVGKTTLVNSLLSILEKQNLKVALCAPTGRAAKKLAESTNKKAKTIHRLLEMNPLQKVFQRNETDPLECDLLVVDEFSMVDITLFRSLLQAIPSSAAVLFVGDVDQLPSIGPGSVLKDMISSKQISVVRLTEIFRQGAGSQIILNAHMINQGITPNFPTAPVESDCFFVKCEHPENALEKIMHIVKERIPQKFGFDPMKDIQVLSPMNRGLLGTQSLNVELQQLLNPISTKSIKKNDMTFSIGDKVMQIENNYDKDVYNGDIGYVADVNKEDEQLMESYEEKLISYTYKELEQLTLAYAITIHKSQGSEYPAIVVPLMTQHYPMLQRNLVYTGMTRGKQLVVLVGQMRAFEMAIKEKQVRNRWTKLNEWLSESGEDSPLL